jgi:hypothetical protein
MEMEFKLSDPLSRRQMSGRPSSDSVKRDTIRTQVRVILDESTVGRLQRRNSKWTSSSGVVTGRLPTTQTPTNEQKTKQCLSKKSHHKNPNTGNSWRRSADSPPSQTLSRHQSRRGSAGGRLELSNSKRSSGSESSPAVHHCNRSVAEEVYFYISSSWCYRWTFSTL